VTLPLGVDTDGKTAEYKALIGDLYPGLATGPNQFKFGHAGTHATLVGTLAAKEADAARKQKLLDLLIVHTLKTNYDSKLQALRWLSTIAKGRIEARGGKVEEVQALFDEETGNTWIAGNADQQTGYLADGAWHSGLVGLGHYPGSSAFANRFNRMVERIKGQEGKLNAANKVLAAGSQVSASGAQPCPLQASAQRQKQKVEARVAVLRPQRFVYPLTGKEPMHAECKLINAWIVGNGGRVQQGRKLYVAGIMRPCMCCSVRLANFRHMLKSLGVELIYKDERNGPFWPTTNAMYGMTAADHASLKNAITNYPPIHVNFARDYSIDSESEDDEALPSLGVIASPAAPGAAAVDMEE
jgi:hypothetical protein